MTSQLNDTQRIILAAAAEREDLRVLPLPKSITAPPVAVRKTILKLLTLELIAEVDAGSEDAVWLNAEGGGRTTLIITPAGLTSIGVEPPSSTEQSDEEPSPPVPAKTGDTKSEIVVALLRRQKGASIEEMMEATNWQPHSVRGFLSGHLKKKGVPVISDKGSDGVRRYFIAPIKSD